jgi:ABC-type multidrug transport system fused ATPase/permease subunit
MHIVLFIFHRDAIMFIFLSLVTILAVLFNERGWFKVDPSILGLSLSMLLQLAGIFQWCVQQSAEVVNLMVSVERVNAFGNLEPEAPLVLDSDKALLEKGWPNHGAIEIGDLSVRYRAALPLALEKASFSIPPGAHVGVVGRTGSGYVLLLIVCGLKTALGKIVPCFVFILTHSLRSQCTHALQKKYSCPDALSIIGGREWLYQN